MRNAAILCAVAICAFGCRTPEPIGEHFGELREEMRSGQAVWKMKGRPELAGELIVIHRSNGSHFAQFAKPPISLMTAETDGARWSATVPPNRTFKGRGKPPERLALLHLARILGGEAPGKNWLWQTNAESWRLEHRKSGESIEGYLSP